jgi:hypothetical protein
VVERLFTALAALATLWLIGCAHEGPTSEELQDQVGRGLRGEGQITPDIDRTGDPYVKPREGPPAPHE